MNATSLFMDSTLAQSMLQAQAIDVYAESLANEQTTSFSEPYLFGSGNPYELQIASSIKDRLDAWRLVYDEYLRKEYAAGDPRGLWYGPFDALPDTTTFLARKNEQPVGALTVVFDGPMGLPADALYGRELNRMRVQGRRLCEIISLAHGEKSQSLLMLKHMFKLAFITAHRLEAATDFIITCTPGHGSFYERQLLFKKIGLARPYGKVNGTVGIMMNLDLTTAEEDYRKSFDHPIKNRNMYRFFASRIPELTEWIRARRRPLDQASIREYFFDAPDRAGDSHQKELLHRVTAAPFSSARNSVFSVRPMSDHHLS